MSLRKCFLFLMLCAVCLLGQMQIARAQTEELPTFLLVSDGNILEQTGLPASPNTIQRIGFDAGVTSSFDKTLNFPLRAIATGFDPYSGRFFGNVSLKVKGRYNRVNSRHIIQHGYEHFSGWPFLFTMLYTNLAYKIYVRGDVGRRFGYRVYGSATYTPGENQTGNNIGWSANGVLKTYTASEPFDVTGYAATLAREPLYYKGVLYSLAVDPRPGTGTIYGNTGPGQSYFLVSGRGIYDETIEVWLDEGMPPVPSFTSKGMCVGEPLTLTSTSYDPDNPGTTPHRGIAMDEWTVIAPSGKTLVLEGASPAFTPTEVGTHTVKLTSTDDEGMKKMTRGSVNVEEVGTIKLLSVDDNNPFTPTITYTVRGTVRLIRYKFNGKTYQIGTKTAGTYSFPIENLFNLPQNSYSLYIYGAPCDAPAASLMDQTKFDNRALPDQKFTTVWPLTLTTHPFVSSLTENWGIYVRRWQWSLPGAKWDRFVNGLDASVPSNWLTLTSTLPVEMGVTHIASPTLTTLNTIDDRTFSYTAVDSIGDPNFWSASYKVPSFSSFGKAGQSVYRLTVAGRTGTLEGSFLWFFPPFGYEAVRDHLLK